MSLVSYVSSGLLRVPVTLLTIDAGVNASTFASNTLAHAKEKKWLKSAANATMAGFSSLLALTHGAHAWYGDKESKLEGNFLSKTVSLIGGLELARLSVASANTAFKATKATIDGKVILEKDKEVALERWRVGAYALGCSVTAITSAVMAIHFADEAFGNGDPYLNSWLN